MSLINTGEAEDFVRHLARSRWPHSGKTGGEIRPSFLRRLDQRVAYVIAEEMARSRMEGVLRMNA